MRIHSEGGDAVHVDPQRKDQENDGSKNDGQKQDQRSNQRPDSHKPNTVSAMAVTRLFRSLLTLFEDTIDDDSEKKLPMIDQRQMREIEEKKNAEMGMG